MITTAFKNSILGAIIISICAFATLAHITPHNQWGQLFTSGSGDSTQKIFVTISLISFFYVHISIIIAMMKSDLNHRMMALLFIIISPYFFYVSIFYNTIFMNIMSLLS